VGKNGSWTSYRFRWDEVVYQPGEVHVVTWKDGKLWANATVQTVGEAAGLRLTADRSAISGDGQDLSFVTVEVVDKDGRVVPAADTALSFSVEGPGELAATDNGNPADMTSFVSKERKAFNGLALAIVRGKPGSRGKATLKVTGAGLKAAQITLTVQ
jgi:beta-galactosidase